MLCAKHAGDRWQSSRDSCTSWPRVEMRNGGGLFSILRPSAFILSTNGATPTRGEPPVQRVGLRSLISTVSWPKVKRQLTEDCWKRNRGGPRGAVSAKRGALRQALLWSQRRHWTNPELLLQPIAEATKEFGRRILKTACLDHPSKLDCLRHSGRRELSVWQLAN